MTDEREQMPKTMLGVCCWSCENFPQTAIAQPARCLAHGWLTQVFELCGEYRPNRKVDWQTGALLEGSGDD